MAGYSEGPESSQAYNIRRIGDAVLDPEKVKNGEPLSNTLASAGVGVALGAISRRIPGIGDLIELGTTVAKTAIENAEKDAQYVAGVQYLAKQNTPGFVFHQTTIGGEQYHITVDASEKMRTPDGDLRIWVDKKTPSGTSSLDGDTQYKTFSKHEAQRNPELMAVVSAAQNKATAGLEEFRITTESEIDQRKEGFLAELSAWSTKFREAKTKEDMQLLGPQPHPVIQPDEVYIKSIMDHDWALRDKILGIEPRLAARTPEQVAAPVVGQ